MKVLFLAAEATPIIKVGGLADVAGELPSYLQDLGVDVRVVIPFHTSIHREEWVLERVVEVDVPSANGPAPGILYRTEAEGSVYYLVDGDPIRTVHGVYSDPYQDGFKFTFAFLAALQAMEQLGWRPDLVHGHDWHVCAALAWLHNNRDTVPFWRETASLLTIHNLPYMGAGSESALETYGIPQSDDPRLPDWARRMPLPLGIATSDWLNAVSPTYAEEIQTSHFGHGLEGILHDRRDRLVGILNGIDAKNWNPETDGDLPHRYSRQELTARRAVKADLLDSVNLTPVTKTPLLGMVTRMDYQKGIDIALQALRDIQDETWQFLLLGTGDPYLEEMARSFGSEFEGRARVEIRFDPLLARRIYGGADMLLIPSRYEPAGLTQMIAMRYGCVPVVSATGGLKDTVEDYDETRSGTGFVFTPNEPQILSETIRRAITVFKDQRRWRGIQLRGMARDFSWINSAREYVQLYEKAMIGRYAQW
ncbi:MAG: glycosyltransferase [Anaerolineales bacterium]|nr:glycosyltransferase [Anaerolineales bacterium]